MKRLAVFVLAGLCVLAPNARGHAQSLKERPLSDTPAQSAPAPAAHPAASPAPAPGQQPGATVQPAPVPQPAAQPAPTARPAQPQPVHPVAPPAPAPAPGGGTPINGSTAISPPPPPPPPPPSQANTYNRVEVNREVMGFFESGSRGLAEIVAKAFRDLGPPNGFIKGNEAGGALVVGLRYGSGTLYLKGLPPVQVYWQSPSLGIDLGVNAVKVFTLVYGMNNPEEIFQRYPGVDGSIYLIGGFGMNYQRSGPITLAPIRFGVGLRLGANVGYQNYSRDQTINPF